jgi:hypothetical protein
MLKFSGYEEVCILPYTYNIYGLERISSGLS